MSGSVKKQQQSPLGCVGRLGRARGLLRSLIERSLVGCLPLDQVGHTGGRDYKPRTSSLPKLVFPSCHPSSV